MSGIVLIACGGQWLARDLGSGITATGQTRIEAEAELRRLLTAKRAA